MTLNMLWLEGFHHYCQIKFNVIDSDWWKVSRIVIYLDFIQNIIIITCLSKVDTRSF